MVKPSAGSARFPSVPVIQVDRDNCELVIKDHLEQALKDADFIAIDCELSGLGDRKRLNCPSMEDRYENLCLVAQTRAIIALGISVFTKSESDVYSVQTFNVMVLCAEDYIVEPMALNFLVQHGFDFQRQYAKGVHYNRGNSEEKSPLRDIFEAIIRNQKPIVLHNGLVDLVFLYQNLYVHLPRTLSAFLADLTQMFPKGIYDTKYLADFIIRSSSSYLEFLFRKEQRSNEENSTRNRPHVRFSFPDYDSVFAAANVEQRHCAITAVKGDVRTVCETFADHGHCPLGGECAKSHDVDLILLKKEGKKRKRKRKGKQGNNAEVESEAKKQKADESMDTNDEDEEESSVEGEVKPAAKNCSGHRAGFDAFMTGFSFTTFLQQHSKDGGELEVRAADLANKVYLVGKSFPMLVQKSAFTKYSENHVRKIAAITGE